ncbi:MAG: hypothetical protein HQL52_03340 [Magnetococcales bacterium]|nr:hypothetical protein [Magnetococcales bacterium]
MKRGKGLLAGLDTLFRGRGKIILYLSVGLGLAGCSGETGQEARGSFANETETADPWPDQDTDTATSRPRSDVEKSDDTLIKEKVRSLFRAAESVGLSSDEE